MTATAFTQNTVTLAPAHWPGISLDELNAKAAMQTRVDRKYIVDGPSTGGNGSEAGTATATSGAAAGDMGGFGGRP